MTLFNGDCLEYLNKIEDNSVDLILTDLPYGNMKIVHQLGKKKDLVGIL